MIGKISRKVLGGLHRALVLAIVLSLLLPYAALASSVDVAVVDVTAPETSVSLEPGASASITIRMSVTGNQDGTATFKVYRNWLLSNGVFTGSNPEGFTVAPRNSNDPATTFSTIGTVSIHNDQAPRSTAYTLAITAFDITNSNTNGAKLEDGNDSKYQVTVVAPTRANTTLSLGNATGTYGGSVDLSARLTSGTSGVNDKTIVFSRKNSSGGYDALCDTDAATALRACPTTASNAAGEAGYATLSSVAVGRDASATAYADEFKASFAQDSTHNASSALASLTVNKAQVTIAPDSGQSKVYGAADPALTFSNNGSLAASSFTGALGRATGENVGSYAINLGTLSAGSNYDLTYVGANFTISQKTVTGSFTAANKVYNGTTDATITGRSLTGALDGDNVSLDGGTASFADKNAGTGKRVNGTGFTLSGTAAGNYSLASSSLSTTASITKKALTGSFTAGDKMYDGTRAATVASRSLPGVIQGDQVSLDVTNTLFDTKNVGTGKDVTGDLSLSGTDAGNYTVNASHTATASITRKALTGSFTAADKEYNGNESATITGSSLVAGGIVSNDDVSLNSSNGSASFANKNVGQNKTVTGTGFVLTGTDAGNYALSMNTTTASITARDITGSFTAEDKTYDGTTDATITGRSLTGALDGDSVSLSGGTATFDTKHVGTGKTVTLAGATLGGDDAGNYNLTSVGTTTASISAKNLTISGAVANNKAYDGNTDATVNFSGATLNGVQGSDAVTINSSAYRAEFGSAGAGTGKAVTVTGVALSGADASNYTVSQPSGLTADINKAASTTTVTVDNTTYNGQPQGGSAVVTGAGGLSQSLTVSYSGRNTTVYGPSTTAPTNAGDYTASASYAESANHLGSSDSKNFSIAKAAATVTLGNLTGHIYDGTAKAATATTNPVGLDVTITYNGSTTAPSAVGSYSVVATVNDANYQGSATGTLTIGAWTLKGFYSPVDMSTSTTMVYNTVKNGSTVPLKFEVFKGTTELTDTAVVSALAKQITCGTGSVDDIEVLATGSTSLRYDTTSGQFIYNWKTPSIANNCYSVTMTTQDGSKITAHFKLK